MLLRQLLSLMLLLLLSACAQRPDPTQPDALLSLNAQQVAVEQLKTWQMRGKLAFTSTEEKVSANINWRQENDHFSVRLSSFVGTTLMSLTSSPELTELDLDNQAYQDTDASFLLWRATGWNIPIKQFPEWLKGQVKAEHADTSQLKYKANGLLDSFITQCAGCGQWLVKFQSYQKVDNTWLPRRILLTNQLTPDNKIKVQINQWQMR